MACCGGGSSVVIVGGEDVVVTGSGTVSDPYVISGNLSVVLQAQDTNTIALDLAGGGNIDDPFILTAVSLVKVRDLLDVNDPVDPVNGDVLTYNGGVWVYAQPSVAAGSVSTAGGIQGDGTVANPIAINVSESIVNATTGLYTYIDTNGELRAQQGGATTGWADVTGKPTTFPPNRPLTADAVVNGNDITKPIHFFLGPTSPTTAVNGDIWYQTEVAP